MLSLKPRKVSYVNRRCQCVISIKVTNDHIKCVRETRGKPSEACHAVIIIEDLNHKRAPPKHS